MLSSLYAILGSPRGFFWKIAVFWATRARNGCLTLKEHILATRVGKNIHFSVRMITECFDLSISEYIRKLILSDLDSRGITLTESQIIFRLSDGSSHSLGLHFGRDISD